MPDYGLYKPTFLGTDRSITAGSAFLAELSVGHRTHRLLISCHHVLGESLPGLRGAAAVSMTEPRTLILAPQYIPIKDARSVVDWAAEGELSVFVLHDWPRGTEFLHLASKSPQVGDFVYLFARLVGASKPVLHRGRVLEISDHSLIYRPDMPDIELGGTSGAPVLNEQGAVVGINVGGGKFADGMHACANPLSAFLPKLTTALSSR